LPNIYTLLLLSKAQLVPVHLPDWTLRVYVAADPAPPQLTVPPRIVNKLRLLGAEIARVSVTAGNNMAPRNWRLLVADDQSLNYFLVHDADSRLSEREVAAVRDWLSTTAVDKNRSAQSKSIVAGVLHCIRDHPKHTDQAIVDGMWGGRPRTLGRLLRQNITQMMMMMTIGGTAVSLVNRTGKVGDVRTWLNEALWPAVSNWSCCHDSVSPCDGKWMPRQQQQQQQQQWAARRPFPLPRQDRLQYVGQKFDAHQQLVSADADQLPGNDVVCPPSAGNFTTAGQNRTQHTNSTLQNLSRSSQLPSNQLITTEQLSST